MVPYRVHLDDWTVALYSTEVGLTITVSNSKEPEHYLTRVRADVALRRYYIGSQCAGVLNPSPWPTLEAGKPPSKEALLAAEGAG
ncbi:MAG: hypothetical protein MK184_11020 [Acidimicrobiales bacterium]|mgnify:FL=1|jgi:hypothetical protein|nr:hypothetical protein [Acidimicrobiales bacterium]